MEMGFFRIILSTTAIVVLNCLALYCQNPVALHYTVDNGLPSNEVYDAIEDDDRNIWFATDHGISKFDGYDFTNYSTADGLSHNTVFQFAEAEGIIWMRCYDGSLSYIEQGKVKSYPYNDTLLKQLGNKYMASFDIDESLHMYFTDNRGTRRTRILNLKTGIIDSIDFPKGPIAELIPSGAPNRRISAVSIPEFQTNIPIPTNRLIQCDSLRKIWELPVPALFNGASRNLNFSRGEDTDVGIAGGSIYLINGCTISKIQEVPPTTQSIYQDQLQNIWLWDMERFYQIDNNFQRMPQSFETFAPRGMLQDHSKKYWFCSLDGVACVRNFKNVLYDQVNGQPFDGIRKLRILDSTLYVLRAGNTILSTTISEDNSYLVFSEQKAEASHYIHDFFPMRLNNMVLLLKSGDDFRRLQPNRLHNKKAWFSMPWQIREQGDTILFVSNQGWNAFNSRTKQFLSDTIGQSIHLSCTSILKDNEGNIWVGTAKGLYVYQNKEFYRFEPKNPITKERVTDFELLPDGTIVVATRGGGIYAIIRNQKIILPQADLLPTKLCDGLHLGPSGLWVISNAGLTLLSLSKTDKTPRYLRKPIHFSVKDGLPTNKVNDVIEFNGVVYIATDKGLVTMRSADLAGVGPPLTVKIMVAKADNFDLDKGGMPSSDEDNLTFRFRAETLPGIGSFVYEYKLEGYDSTWRSTSDQEVQYYNVPPGTYTFHVKADYSITTDEPEDYVKFTLPKKPTEQLWVQISLGFLGVGVSLLVARQYYKGRHRRLRARTARLQSEIKVFRSQMRPHFIYNLLNSIYNLILNNDNAAAKIYLLQFAKLMRMVLDASHYETISIATEQIILKNYLDLEKLRFGKDFVFLFEEQEEVDWESYRIPPMLLQPIVENAIWHGLRMKEDNPKLWIRFSLLNTNTVCCEVEDNGIGRKAAALLPKMHKEGSIGVKNIEERIKLLNAIKADSVKMEVQDLLTDAGEAAGTKVIITLFQ